MRAFQSLERHNVSFLVILLFLRFLTLVLILVLFLLRLIVGVVDEELLAGKDNILITSFVIKGHSASNQRDVILGRDGDFGASSISDAFNARGNLCGRAIREELIKGVDKEVVLDVVAVFDKLVGWVQLFGANLHRSHLFLLLARRVSAHILLRRGDTRFLQLFLDLNGSLLHHGADALLQVLPQLVLRVTLAIVPFVRFDLLNIVPVLGIRMQHSLQQVLHNLVKLASAFMRLPKQFDLGLSRRNVLIAVLLILLLL
mmetsp:Transcript_4094/g.6968  ORF Transcript_4094/g.6968 Transcript_4094/m.6968 type:complete len:258 (-) Transcript_4094:932-1705(-)